MRQLYIEPKESEEKYLELRRRGLELRTPIIEAFLDLQLRDKFGKVYLNTRQRSHSWVRNAYNFLTSFMTAVDLNGSGVTFGAGYINSKTTGAVIKNGNLPGSFGSGNDVEALNICGFRAGATITTFGIVVGTGVTAESFEDFALVTPIAHGVGAGQMSYTDTNAPVESYDAPSKTYSVAWKRFINNNSGGDITVNEVGLVSKIADGTNGFNYYLFSRDLTTTLVANTAQLGVTYTLAVVFPG